MTRNRLIFFGLLAVLLVVLLDRCTTHSVNVQNDLLIELSWSPSFPEHKLEEAQAGFRWTLAYLGAMLPEENDSLFLRIEESDSTSWSIDFQHAGFSASAENILASLLWQFKESEEYQETGTMDLGRFIALTLNSSWHYYALTDISPTIQEFESRYQFNDTLAYFQPGESEVSREARIVRCGPSYPIEKVAFIALEGEKLRSTEPFGEDEFEVVDIMPNGQIRVGIYNKTGELIEAANSRFSIGGKPAKCLWCHEFGIQPAFRARTETEGFMSLDDFYNRTRSASDSLWSYRTGLNTSIPYVEYRSHTEMEILYISFMEPSLYRLCREWKMDSTKTRTLLNNLDTHIHHEFPKLGQLYQRDQVDQKAPFKSLRPPSDAREKGSYEPNLLAQ